ncbi:MAG: hypothetical protein QXP31_05045 [Pyrobaculum sp.]
MAFVKRGFVEFDVVNLTPEVESALFEVGVRAVVLREEAEAALVAPFVRGVDFSWAEARGRHYFNKLIHREVQVIRVNPLEPITRDQARAAYKYGKYVELPLRPLLRNLPLLAEWLRVLEPEGAIVSTAVEGARDVKSPLDIAALLVEISGDEDWAKPIKNSLGILTELVAGCTGT